MALFQRPSISRRRQRSWRRAAEAIGADFLPQRHQRPDTIQRRSMDWIITLDSGRSSEGSAGTHVRAPFVNSSGFRFLIYRTDLFSEIGKRLVLLQDLVVGHPGIDRRFVVQSTRPDAVRELMRVDRVRQLLWLQTGPGVRLGISENAGMLGGSYPAGVDLLHYQTTEEVLDTERIRQLFDLFEGILEHVTNPLGEALVERHLRRLRGPGGIITGKVTLWEGGPARYDALREITRLRDPDAVDTLLETVHDKDPVVQAKSVYALGKIGDERALPTLIRLLGKRLGQLRRKLNDDAGEALIGMGYGTLVAAFDQALEGDAEALAREAKRFRSHVIEALITALAGPGLRSQVSHTVQALTRMNAVEALPELRRRLNSNMLPTVREAYEEAIEALQARTSLPRPATSSSGDAGTLPKPATSPGPRGETLPKAADGRDTARDAEVD